MNVLVTGATGFLGSHVVKELKKSGFKLKCLVRKNSNTELLEQLGIPFVYGDISDKRALKLVLKGVDTVLHMAVIIKSPSKKLYYDINHQGTKNLVEACEDNKVKRFIHISTHDVVFNRGDYSISKLKGEEVVRNSKLDFTILRPTVVYGKGKNSVTKLARLIKTAPIVLILGNGRAKLQPIYVGDVAKIIVKVIKTNKTIGKTYSLGGPDEISFEALADLIMEETRMRKAKIHIPIILAKSFIWGYEKIAPRPFMTVDGLTLLTYDKICDNSAAIKDLKFKLTRIKEGIKYLSSNLSE